jgi:DNA-binding response OmpR family regulator
MNDVVAGKRRAWRVVVAEDDPDMRALVCDALTREGYEVTALPDGARLLVRIARQYRHLDPAAPIDLIVSDIRMPVVSGLEILQGLRDAHCRTPVILMTAFGDPALRRQVEALGALLLDKPVRIEEICARARQLLEAGY